MKHISEFLPTIEDIAAGRLMTRDEFNETNMEAMEERLAICLEAGIPYAQAAMTANKEFIDRLTNFLETA
jgi:hypothetical protein